MSTPENIQRFNFMTGRIFARLYSMFPEPVILTAFNCQIVDVDPWKISEEFAEQQHALIEQGIGVVTENGRILGPVETLLVWNPNVPPDLPGELKRDLAFFYSTLAWLKDTGFIDGVLHPGGTVMSRGVLTAKGLESLSAIPDSIVGSAPLGEILLENTKKGATAVIGETVKQVLAVGIGLAARHYGITP